MIELLIFMDEVTYKRNINEAILSITSKIYSIEHECRTNFPYYREENKLKWFYTESCNWSGGHWASMLLMTDSKHDDNKVHVTLDNIFHKIKLRMYDSDIFTGFIFYYSYARRFEIYGRYNDLEIALEVADNLVSMYNKNIGLIPLGNECKVLGTDIHGNNLAAVDGSIIANILLYWAYDKTKKKKCLDTALNNLNNTIRIFMREDYSVTHMIEFVPYSGTIIRKWNNLGYSSDSTWSRGQAWFLLALAYGYRHTHNPEYQRIYLQALNFYLKNNNNSSMVPFYDLDAPMATLPPLDTSALAILAESYIIMLFNQGTQDEELLREIFYSFTPYIDSSMQNYILNHGCFDKPRNVATNADLIYSDYYLLSFLLHLKNYLSKGK